MLKIKRVHILSHDMRNNIHVENYYDCTSIVQQKIQWKCMM